MDLASLTRWLTLVGLVAVMLAMGLRVRAEEVAASARRTGLVVRSLAANFLLVPAAAIALLYLFNPHPLVSAGFLMLAVCPGAPVSPPLVGVARGDVPCAVGLMVILAGLSSVLSPILLSVLLELFLPASELLIDYGAIVRTLLIVQMLPLAIGLSLHHWLPAFADRIARPLTPLANFLLLGVIVLLLTQEHETLLAIRLRAWLGMLLLLAVSLGVGWLCGGPDRATRKALALTTSVRNVAVALVIVSSNFARTPAVTAVIAYGLVSILISLGSACWLATVPDRTTA